MTHSFFTVGGNINCVDSAIALQCGFFVVEVGVMKSEMRLLR